MNKSFFILILGILFFSCNARFERAMKSTDPVKIMEAADYYNSVKKYSYAISLYERMVPFVAGTDLAPEVAFKSAETNYAFKNYTLAGHQYKNFNNGFRNDPRSENALYKSAICYHKSSSEYNLDQTNTLRAITEMQNFIDTYPNSEKLAECNLMINELQQKLELKAFENAKTFYKTAKYKAAVTAFGDMMSDFPDSKLKEDVYYYNLLSKYELAKKSIFTLKKERIIETSTASKLLLKEFPESKYKSETLSIQNKLVDLTKEFEKQKDLIEDQKKLLTEKN